MTRTPNRGRSRSTESLDRRVLDDVDDTPTTTILRNSVQVEGEDFFDESSLEEPEYWDFLPAKSLSIDWEYLQIHLVGSVDVHGQQGNTLEEKI